MTTTELTARKADRFELAPDNYLFDVDRPAAGVVAPTRPEAALQIEMEMPTVLLPAFPLAGFDRLRRTVRDDFRQLLDEIDDYLDALGGVPVAPATPFEAAAPQIATETATAIRPSKRRWLRRAPRIANQENNR